MAPAQVMGMHWQLRTTSLDLSDAPLWMGIVNVTPDSFSDGGAYLDPQAAIAHGLRLAAEGAAILDVGGESTRPYAEKVDEREELRRVLPVVQVLAEQAGVPVSIDTSKALVARECLAAGAEMINDITGLRGDDQMLEVALASRAGVCVMHMQGTPQTMQDAPAYGDVVAEIAAFLADRRGELIDAGIDPGRIGLDPGIGFGKTHEHNRLLAANAWRFVALGSPVLVGHSRKGFIGKALGDREADRTLGTVGLSLALARQGVHVLRVHDVRPHREALALFRVGGGMDSLR